MSSPFLDNGDETMSEMITGNLGVILAATGGGAAFAAVCMKLLQAAGCKQTTPAEDYQNNSGAHVDGEESP